MECKKVTSKRVVYIKFHKGRRYWSDDKYEFYIIKRFDRTKLIRGYIGFAMPGNYKIRINFRGCEYITVKGHTFTALY